MNEVQAERLRELLIQKHGVMDQKKLAAMLCMTESSLTKFLKGHCKRQRTEDQNLSRFAMLLGMTLVELKAALIARSPVSAFEEENDRSAIEDAIRVLKNMQGGDVQFAVVDLIWDGVYSVVSDMVSPSLEMMEFLVEEITPLLDNPRLRGTRNIKHAFMELLLGKMQHIWKCILRDSESRRRVLEVYSAIETNSKACEKGHQISSRFGMKNWQR